MLHEEKMLEVAKKINKIQTNLEKVESNQLFNFLMQNKIKELKSRLIFISWDSN